MLKGLPEEARGIRWHRRHERALAKAERRHKKGHIAIDPRLALSKTSNKQWIEEQFKRSQEKTRSLMSRFERWMSKLQPIIWARRIAHEYRERQYTG